MSTSLSYRDAGVGIDAGDQLVEKIKPFAKRTMRPEVLGDLGGFGALVEIGKKYQNPVLVSGTDGVGKAQTCLRLGQTRYGGHRPCCNECQRYFGSRS